MFSFFTQYYVNRYVPWCAPTKICCIFGITTSRQYEDLNAASGKRNNRVRLCVFVLMLFCECMKRLLWGRLISVHKLHPVTIQLHFHFLLCPVVLLLCTLFKYRRKTHASVCRRASVNTQVRAHTQTRSACNHTTTIHETFIQTGYLHQLSVLLEGSTQLSATTIG